MYTRAVVNIGSFHQFFLPQWPIVYFNPHIRAPCVRPLNSPRFTQEKQIFPVISIKPGDRKLSAFNFTFMGTGSMGIKQKMLAELRLFNRQRQREVSAVEQQLSIFILAMPYG